jgi:hypothetical protein
MTTFLLSETGRLQIENIIQRVQNGSGLDRIHGLEKLWVLSESDEMKEALTLPDFGLLKILKDILINDDVDVHKNCIGCLWYLSRNTFNRTIFCSTEVDLLPLLMNFLRNDHPNKNMIRSLLLNCSLDKANHLYLLRDSLGYIEYLRNELINQPTSPLPYRACCYLTMTIENSSLLTLQRYHIHELIMNYLVFCGSNPSEWLDRHNGPEYWALNFLVDLISLSEGLKAIQSLNKMSYFMDLMSCQEMEGLKATCIVANLLDYHQEVTDDCSFSVCLHGQSLFTVYPHIFPLLMEVFEATIAAENIKKQSKILYIYGFAFGIITMRVISSTLKRLSYSNENKAIMFRSSSLLPLVLSMIEMFNVNAPELRVKDNIGYSLAGGGGKDFETLESLLELLVQFYFYYQSISDLPTACELVKDHSDVVVPERNSSLPEPQEKSPAVNITREERSSQKSKQQFAEHHSRVQEVLEDLLKLPEERQVPRKAKELASIVLRFIPHQI